MRSFTALASGILLSACGLFGDPIAVRHVQGYLHGFLALKDTSGKILASGDLTQTPKGDRVTTVLRFRFRDGSLYEETSVFSQKRQFRLVSYRRVEKGPEFKTPETLALDASSGSVNIQSTDEHGKVKTIDKQLALPDDLANGIQTMLLSNVDPKAESTLSMLASTPEPRIVKLKISAEGEDTFFVAGAAAKATRFVVNVDIGGAAGVMAKVVGKQPPPTHVWMDADSPVFLRSEGPLWEDGPVVRIELTEPTWPKPATNQAAP